MLMSAHRPDGVMLLERDSPCEGFRLVARNATRRRIAFARACLPAANYNHLLDEGDPFELRRLGDNIAQRAATVKGALELVGSARGAYIPLLLL